MAEPIPISPSNASRPDLDWSQVRETILMLNLAVAQIELTLKHGNESVSTLGDSFTSMAGNVEVIRRVMLAQPSVDKNLESVCDSVAADVQNAIVAFQFYDKLTQRLSHLSHSMNCLARLVADPSKLYNPLAWVGLQEKIKSSYTVESDRAMFKAILNGASVEDALHASELAKQQEADDDIEFF